MKQARRLLQEASEEVRLQAIRMIGGPVVARCGPQLQQHADGVAAVLQQALADPFHEIKKVGTMHPSFRGYKIVPHALSAAPCLILQGDSLRWACWKIALEDVGLRGGSRGFD